MRRLLLALALPCAAAGLELKDGWYHLDGHRFLVNALGYESGARPGEAPYETRGRDLDQVRRDLELIKAAGFNAIRTWSQMSEPELKVVQASGLKIVFGIWLKPDEDFADPAVAARDLELIRSTLAYTRAYDCVITYLIMNEPMPEHIRKVGAAATRDLWARATALIHELHPGVPVTISGNAAITEWVDMGLFDVRGRNAYDYRDSANFTHGFAEAQRMLAGTDGKPALLTEFGRSVSRKGEGLYGGNTLGQQAEAMTRYYRDFLDAGGTGLCPFYYADGWWKAGNPAVHDDEAEEWFGMLGFGSLKDAAGHPRPAWYALAQYNLALVASPRNHAFYRETVPLEAHCQPAVKRIRVVFRDRVLLEAVPDARGRATGEVRFPGEGLTDRELVVEALDAAGRVLKWETLVVLTGKDPVEWPRLELATGVDGLRGAREVPVTFRLGPTGPFKVDGGLRYAFSPHKGWEPGETRTRPIAPGAPVADAYRPPAGCAVLSVFGGVDVRFGKFVKTLTARRFLYDGPWADPLRVRE
ncbi:glycoside hydrolase 5 family protein [Mesoterricola silvestris]|uniref:Glycoside hydrolase family 2 catalytic domain-containing protein n=1 Tax=Mesoterricola silvestris TaxID=2927979 RepID=A0AA48K7H3_9BACT|nr:hypothetical protein [Mesoterricola silvestris]BDU71869.1 hypothetical protein METEAL_10430 [Mesoterricola silvestris]